MAVRPPDGPTFDIVGVVPQAVTVGGVYRFQSVITGAVQQILQPGAPIAGMWVFRGGGGTVNAPIPSAPDSDWVWSIERQVTSANLAQKFTDPATGASWVYFQDEQGGYRYCYDGPAELVGKVLRGASVAWLGVASPADVVVGGTYRFTVYQRVAVSEVLAPGAPGGDTLGWSFKGTHPVKGDAVTIVYPVTAPAWQTVSVWREQAKTAVGVQFRAQDGSGWIAGSGGYQCFAAGTKWRVGSIAAADDIAGVGAYIVP